MDLKQKNTDLQYFRSSYLSNSFLQYFPLSSGKNFWCMLQVHLPFHLHITFSVYLFLLKERNSYSPVCYWGQTASWYLHRSPSQRLPTGNVLTIPHAHAVSQFDRFTKTTHTTVNIRDFQDSRTKSVMSSHCGSLIFFEIYFHIGYHNFLYYIFTLIFLVAFK